jgi:hypothetical protein
MKHNHGRIKNAKLRVDGSGDREFKQAFKAYVRSKVGRGVIAKSNFVGSEKDSLIQLADMVAGAIARAHKEPRNDASFLDRIRHKIEDLWRFG